MLRRVFFQKSQPPFTHVAFGRVDDTPERQVVLVGDHPQVAEGVLDFRPVEELHTAVDGVRYLFFQKYLLYGPGHIVSPVQEGDIRIFHTFCLQAADLFADPLCLAFLGVRKMTNHRRAGGTVGQQFLLDAVFVFFNEGIGCCQDFRCGTVILHHHDSPGARKLCGKIHQETPICSPPAVNSLVRVTHHEQVPVPGAQRFHQLILEGVDVLEFVDHDVLQPLLPFQTDVFPFFENMQRELDQVVVIQSKTFLFLIEITEKNDILCPDCCVILFFQRFQGKGNHVLVIFRSFEQLLYLDHIPGHGKGHVPQGQAPLFVYDLQHGVDV